MGLTGICCVAERSHINYEIKDGIAVVRFNDPNSKVNSLNEHFIADAKSVFSELNSAAVKGIVLISGKTDCFVAGADINMLEKCKSALEAETISRDGQKFFAELENSPVPVVAAIQGSCLGGGLELALAAHYRIAVNDKRTVLAVPEVMLGLLPGGGGTQRLPRLVPVPDALQMMLMGKNIRPAKAKKMGLVDQVVDPIGPGVAPADVRTLEYLEEVAVQTCLNLANKKLKIDRKKPLPDRKCLFAFLHLGTNVPRHRPVPGSSQGAIREGQGFGKSQRTSDEADPRPVPCPPQDNRVRGLCPVEESRRGLPG